MLLHIGAYAGVPAANVAFAIGQQVLAEDQPSDPQGRGLSHPMLLGVSRRGSACPLRALHALKSLLLLRITTVRACRSS